MFKYKIKNSNLTTWLLLIKSYLIISAIYGGNSQHTKPGDCSEFYNFTVLNKSRQIFWILQLHCTVLYFVLFSSFEYPWPRQLNCPSQWVSRAATRAITPENHCLGQCLFRWVNIGILICSLNQFLNRPMKGKLSDLTQRLLTGMLWWVGVIK